MTLKKHENIVFLIFWTNRSEQMSILKFVYQGIIKLIFYENIVVVTKMSYIKEIIEKDKAGIMLIIILLSFQWLLAYLNY